MLRVAGIVEDSVVDGPGLRLTVFTQGCPHHCPGCHNPGTHPEEGGVLVAEAEILRRLEENPLLDGLTLSGGEPLLQMESLGALLEGVRAMQRAGRRLDVVLYTGYVLEEVLALPGARALLEGVDVLVDGPFVAARRTFALPYRGSANQRAIDVGRTLATGRVVTTWAPALEETG